MNGPNYLHDDDDHHCLDGNTTGLDHRWHGDEPCLPVYVKEEEDA